MWNACAKGAPTALVLLLVLSLAACDSGAGPGGVHEGDYFSARVGDVEVAGFVSGWEGRRWIEIHKAGDLVQRIDLEQLTSFKVRCSHE